MKRGPRAIGPPRAVSPSATVGIHSERRDELETPNQVRLAVAALVVLAVVGAFKGLPFLSAAPVDATAIGAVGALVALVVNAWRLQPFNGRAIVSVLALWATFAFGVLALIGRDGPTEKSLLLYSVTLITVILAASVSWSDVLQRAWVFSSIAAGVIALPLFVFYPDIEYQNQFGRVALVNTSTIGISRVIAAASLSALLLGAMGQRRRVLLLMAGGAGLLAVALIGNRGAFISICIAAAVTFLTAKALRSRRGAFLAVGIATMGALAYLATLPGARGLSRILSFLGGQSHDEARVSLYGAAFRGILESPWGVGWGRFESLTPLPRDDMDGDVHPHNILLEVGSEGGWIALVAILSIAVIAFLGHRRNSESNVGTVLMAQFVFWFAAAQTSSDINGNRAMWITLTAGVVLYFRHTYTHVAKQSAAPAHVGQRPS